MRSSLGVGDRLGPRRQLRREQLLAPECRAPPPRARSGARRRRRPAPACAPRTGPATVPGARGGRPRSRHPRGPPAVTTVSPTRAGHLALILRLGHRDAARHRRRQQPERDTTCGAVLPWNLQTATVPYARHADAPGPAGPSRRWPGPGCGGARPRGRGRVPGGCGALSRRARRRCRAAPAPTSSSRRLCGRCGGCCRSGRSRR